MRSNSDRPPRVADLPDTEWQECEAILRQFAEDWTPDRPPCFDDELTLDDRRWGLLLELVLTDIELRWRAGCPLPIEEYIFVYPELVVCRPELEAADAEFARRGVELLRPCHDRYFLQAEIGRGAFGVVWRAWDTRLRRTVAIKRSMPGLAADPIVRRRLVREAQFVAQLQHPAIATVHDAIEAGDGVDLIMEFIEGESLAQRLRNGPLPPLEAAQTVAIIAEAVGFAHERGFIHRDIKPGNILLGSATPKLSDFGLARGGELESLQLTSEGQIFGTPAFMAPETLTSAAAATPSSDIYSLGVVLYQSLTGEVPFRGQLRMVMRQIVEDEPLSPRRWNDLIPRDLETICLKAMAKESAHRYASARAMADDLRRLLNGEPILARPIRRIDRVVRWVRRWPGIAGLLAALIITLIAGVTGIYMQWQRAEYFLAESRGRLTDVTAQKERGDAMLRHVHDAVSDFVRATQDDPALIGPEFSTIRLRFIDTALEHYREMEKQLPEDPTLWLQLADIYENQGLQRRLADQLPSQILPAFENATAFRERLIAHAPDLLTPRLRLVQTLLNLAAVSRDAGQPDRSVVALQRAEAVLEPLRQICQSDPERCRTESSSIAGVGTSWLYQRGAFAGWRQEFPSSVFYHSGLIAAQQQHWADADRYWSECIRLLDESASQEPERTASFEAVHQRSLIECNRGHACVRLGDTSRARQALIASREGYWLWRDRSIELTQRLRMLEVLPRLQEAFEESGDYESAIAIGQWMLRDWTMIANRFPTLSLYARMRGVCLHELGNLLDDVGDTSACEQAYRDALAIRLQICEQSPRVPRLHLDLSATAFSLARWLQAQQRTEEVDALYLLAIREMQAVLKYEPNNRIWQQYLRDRIDAHERFIRLGLPR